MTMVRAWWYIPQEWNMLDQLLSSQNNCQSMVIYHTCINMLCQLSSSHDNGQSMVIYPSGMNHAPSVVIVKWQRSEHGYITLRYESCSVNWIVSWQRSEYGNLSHGYEPCSVSCHRLMIKVRAWWYIPHVWNMLRQLPSSLDTDRAWLFIPKVINHAPSVVIVSWQRSEHGNISLMYEPCSVSCHRLMTTDRAWLYTPQVWIMLRQLPSSHDNGHSMLIYPSCIKHAPLDGMNHAPSVVIVSW